MEHERGRVERVVARLNGEFANVARFEAIRWETKFYRAHRDFQSQIPEAAECDLVLAIFWSRLGSQLPPEFPRMADGEPYPSGSAYELLTALEARRKKPLPDVYVFKKTADPLVALNDREKLDLAQQQWARLQSFFETWFQNRDGSFLAAFQTFKTPDQFETQVEKLLRDWLAEHLAADGPHLAWPIEIKGSPFCGLNAFDAEHAAVFFGRERDVALAVEQLSQAAKTGTPFLLVIGASGVGKSSFMQAGLVPRLTTPGVVNDVELWRAAAMRPGNDPIAALAAALYDDALQGQTRRGLPELAQGDYATPEKLVLLMRHGAGAAVPPIIAALDRLAQKAREQDGRDVQPRTALILAIDQLDEVFAHTVTAADRALFAGILAALAATGRVWIVTTLRGDLYEHYLAEPALFTLKQSGAHYDLVPPGAAELVETIRKPAQAAGLEFEAAPNGERLDERLLRDAGAADVLPLLQFTLQRLFDQRQDHRLTLAAYDSFGGLGGAIDQAAEVALAPLDPAALAMLPALFRKLVGLAHAEGPLGAERAHLTLRPVPAAEFPAASPGGKLVRALVEARILISEGGYFRLAHQRVLESWRRAATLIQANQNYYRVAGDVRTQMRRWLESGLESSALLPRGSLLKNARSILAELDSPFDQAAREFIAASRWRAKLPTLNIAMLCLVPVNVFFAIGIPNIAAPALRTVMIFPVLGIFAAWFGGWPLTAAAFSWQYRRHALKAVCQLASQQASRMHDGGEIGRLEQGASWQMRGAMLNAVMAPIFLLGALGLLFSDIKIFSSAQAALSGILLFAAIMLFVVWPAGLFYLRLRRRRALKSRAC